ncbi:MAG: DUF1788 domain-containing protein [Methanospirillaceae archaeon]|nr:DUF1788 domain-containing protein [Methanospirillaceae archaeon]
MSSLTGRIEQLRQDIMSSPPRISVYREMPFAIFRYNPEDEWTLRSETQNLAIQLRNAGKNVVLFSMETILWEILEKIEEENPGEGRLGGLIDQEKFEGFSNMQEQMVTYLSDEEYCPLSSYIEKKLNALNPKQDIGFLVHVGALAPHFYQVSKLLDELQGRVAVTTILFYPGSLEEPHGLRFMDMHDRPATGGYRVKIY